MVRAQTHNTTANRLTPLIYCDVILIDCDVILIYVIQIYCDVILIYCDVIRIYIDVIQIFYDVTHNINRTDRKTARYWLGVDLDIGYNLVDDTWSQHDVNHRLRHAGDQTVRTFI